LQAFVLTDVSGLELYCCCLQFYETLHLPLPPDPTYGSGNGNDRTSENFEDVRSSGDLGKGATAPKGGKRQLMQHEKTIWAPKAICLISHWPFCDNFHQYLTDLYRTSAG
jgi:hypothetical protein